MPVTNLSWINLVFVSDFFFKDLICKLSTYVCICMWKCAGECWYLQNPEEEVGSTGAGATGEWPNMGARN